MLESHREGVVCQAHACTVHAVAYAVVVDARADLTVVAQTALRSSHFRPLSDA